MKAEKEDRPSNNFRKQRNPWLVVGIITAINAAILYSLTKTGWGITIDLKKLSEAIYINGSKNAKNADKESLAPTSEPIEIPSTNSAGLPSRPRQMPVAYEISLKKFNRIFIQHPACNPYDMKWTQMDCSNFRARAMKRFHEEWRKGSYWNGYRVIENKEADKEVNIEINE
ncbi:hypothetical protein D9M68_732890 [compost metagenome]